MSSSAISAADPYQRRRIPVLDTDMAYIESGQGEPVVFLHGNPTSSYLWRNIIPYIEVNRRCLAPDLIGMGESRRPTLTWPREIPIDGEPADVTQIVDGYAQWLAHSDVPKLFINADPGSILTGAQREFCRSWPNQEEQTVKGIHFVQEDSPAVIGAAISGFVERIS